MALVAKVSRPLFAKRTPRPKLRPWHWVWILCLLAPPAAGRAAAAGELDEMLRRFAEHAARVKALSQSGVTVTTRAEQLDGKGRVETRTESVDRRFWHDGAEVVELRRFLQDGKDTTAEAQKRRAERKAKAKGKEEKSSMNLSISSPFSAEAAARHRFQLAGPDPADPRLLRVRFEPKGKPSPEANIGEAAVDPESGTVHWIRFRPSVNPKHVTRMQVDMTFGLEAPGGPALSRVAVEGEGGLLFIKKGFRSESTFSDYGGGATR